MTGKANYFSCVEQFAHMAHPKLTAFREMFDEGFCARHRNVIDSASAIVSLYGDEGTWPCLEIAARFDVPCAIIPCNECAYLFPPNNKTYEGYVRACVEQPNEAHRGRMEWVQMRGSPFSQQLVVQWPRPEALRSAGEYERDACRWSQENVQSRSDGSVVVPIEVLKKIGVLGQILWKCDLANRAC